MKIILIGNKGQVGREITQMAATQQINLVGFDLDNLDITSQTQVNNTLLDHKNGNILINAAAYTAVDLAENEPETAFAVNRDGVKNLALACHKYDIPLLHISTDYVFDGKKNTPYLETDITNPSGIYGASKLQGEQILAQTWGKHLILRVSWVFGKYGKNFVKTILNLAHKQEQLNIIGDQFGCPTAARDIARVLLTISLQIYYGKNAWGIYNYCNKSITTWYDFAQEIIKIASQKTQLQIKQLNKITTSEYPTKAKRPTYSALTVAKIKQNYNISQRDWYGYLRQVIDETIP